MQRREDLPAVSGSTTGRAIPTCLPRPVSSPHCVILTNQDLGLQPWAVHLHVWKDSKSDRQDGHKHLPRKQCLNSFRTGRDRTVNAGFIFGMLSTPSEALVSPAAGEFLKNTRAHLSLLMEPQVCHRQI